MIMKDRGYFDDKNWNKTDYTYTFETGSTIEFFSADQPGKVRGPRRDRLFINEANNVPHETFDQLEVRTKEFIYLDWNPVSEFWYYNDVLVPKENVDHLVLTYKDNEALPQGIIDSIELRRERKGWWKVYGEGQLGEAENKIYRGWQEIDEVPRNARLERYGLDFGYSNDPTALIAIYYYDQGYIWDEICYQKGLLNKQIADIILNQPQALVIADSAEPKSIDELKMYGVNVLGVDKKKGETKNENFVKWSIGLVQDQKITVTKRSTNILKEYRNYLWQTDKNEVILNVPEDIWDHAMDAGRYAMTSMLKMPGKFVEASPMPPKHYPSIGL
jgi:phage terminase large subunit